jgi:hypothetical protein
LWLLGTSATILYIIIVPESPRWLLLNSKHRKAIDVLNYIAKFNCSKETIPSNARFDYLNQAIVQQNKTVSKAQDGMLKAYEEDSVFGLTVKFLHEESNHRNQTFAVNSGLISSLKKLLSFTDESNIMYRGSIIFHVSIGSFQFILLNLPNLGGNLFENQIVAGTAFIFAMILSQVLGKVMKDCLIMLIATLLLFSATLL